MGAKHQTQERIDWAKVEKLKAQGLTPEVIRERLGISHSMRPRKEPMAKRVKPVRAGDRGVLTRAKAAADAIFSDTTVSPATTKADLEDLISHVQIMITALAEDERR